MIITYNETCTIHSNLITDITMVKKTGFEAIELMASKLYRYLDAGFTLDDLKKALGDFPSAAIGFVEDIERQGAGFEKVMEDTERMCKIAQKLDCPNVQLLTGPLAVGIAGNPMYGDVKVSEEYIDLIQKPWPEIRALTAKNLRELCKIGKKYGRRFYLEMLGWTPAAPLVRGKEIVDECGEDNVGVIIDFWHMYVGGTSPDIIAKTDKSYINGAHFCDSLKVPEDGKIDQTLRDVYPGLGYAPMNEYISALKATGYEGWIAGECFSSLHTEMEAFDVMQTMYKIMEFALAGGGKQ